jgi:hypothetical protein
MIYIVVKIVQWFMGLKKKWEIGWFEWLYGQFLRESGTRGYNYTDYQYTKVQ